MLAHLRETIGEDFKPSQWFRFIDRAGERWCQVDGLIRREGLTAIFEVKTRFTSDAWFQLRQLYEPVVRAAFVEPTIRLFIVCRNFDPAAPFPEPVDHLQGLNCLLPSEGGGLLADKISVYSWRP